MRRPLPHSTASTTRSSVCARFTLSQLAPRRPPRRARRATSRGPLVPARERVVEERRRGGAVGEARPGHAQRVRDGGGERGECRSRGVAATRSSPPEWSASKNRTESGSSSRSARHVERPRPKRRIVTWNGSGEPSGGERDGLAVEHEREDAGMRRTASTTSGPPPSRRGACARTRAPARRPCAPARARRRASTRARPRPARRAPRPRRRPAARASAGRARGAAAGTGRAPPLPGRARPPRPAGGARHHHRAPQIAGGDARRARDRLDEHPLERALPELAEREPREEVALLGGRAGEERREEPRPLAARAGTARRGGDPFERRIDVADGQRRRLGRRGRRERTAHRGGAEPDAPLTQLAREPARAGKPLPGASARSASARRAIFSSRAAVPATAFEARASSASCTRFHLTGGRWPGTDPRPRPGPPTPTTPTTPRPDATSTPTATTTTTPTSTATATRRAPRTPPAARRHKWRDLEPQAGTGRGRHRSTHGPHATRLAAKETSPARNPAHAAPRCQRGLAHGTAPRTEAPSIVPAEDARSRRPRRATATPQRPNRGASTGASGSAPRDHPQLAQHERITHAGLHSPRARARRSPGSPRYSVITWSTFAPESAL